MVREFKLINEQEKEFSLMDIKNYCLLTDPEGLGYSYTNEYEQIGNSFINSLKRVNQETFSGTVNFINYDNYRKLLDFIENSKSLRLYYKIPYEEKEPEIFYRNIEIESLSKTQKQENGIISESITFKSLSLWYKIYGIEYEVKPSEDDLRWNFRWDSKFTLYNTDIISYDNEGHVPAQVKIEVRGYTVNPSFKVFSKGNLVQEININITLQEGEKLIYSSLENEFYLEKVDINGEKTNIYNLDTIDFSENNVLRIPQGESSLYITTKEALSGAKIQIYSFYK